MNSLLGLNTNIAGSISTEEVRAYRIVNLLFLAVICLSIFSCGYFGYLLTNRWEGIVLFSSLMGFIHFCILRISLITLMTKPLIHRQIDNTDAPLKKIYQRIHFTSADVARYIFVGLIALTIAVPISASFFHDRGKVIEENHRHEMIQTSQMEIQISSAYQNKQLANAHFPFIIFSQLSVQFSFKVLCMIFTLFVFSPLILLHRLRNNKNFSYMDLCREEMRREVQIDYDETLEQSQYYISANFPMFRKRLSDLTVYADAPFNNHFKQENKPEFSSREEFLKAMIGS